LLHKEKHTNSTRKKGQSATQRKIHRKPAQFFENSTKLCEIYIRDRSLFIVQGGIEEKLEGPLNFFKPERRGLEKIQRDERRGALKRFTCLKKH
jgi:hypothetical protein